MRLGRPLHHRTLLRAGDPVTDLAAILARRHPDYAGPLGTRWWQLVRDAVGGRGGFRHAVERGRTEEHALGDYALRQEQPLAGSYLRRFQRETAESFAERQRVSFYRNHTRTIVAQYQGHLWRRPPERATSIATVAAWWADVDGEGTPVARWLAQGSRRAQMFGWAAALFDRPADPQSVASARTSARWLQPEELVDWGFGEDGALEWARLCTEVASRGPYDDSATAVRIYTTWTRYGWERHRVIGDAVEQVAEAPHALGAVPLAFLYWQPPEEPGALYGTSHLDSAVAASLELFNVSSEARHVERGTAFPVLYIQSRDERALQGLALGTHAGLVVEPDVSMVPGFLTVPADLNTHFAARRAELRDEIYRAANIDPPQADGTTPESGIARAYKFLPRRSVLVDACEQLAAFERDAVSLLARWDGADPAAHMAATRIAYPSDFDVQDSDGVIERSAVVLQASDVPVTKRAARVQMGRAVSPHASPEEDAALTREADALYQRERASLTDPAAPGNTDPAAPGANGGGNGPAAGA